METTDRPEKWTAYYETLQTKVRLDLSAIKEVLKEKDFLDWLSKQYLDVWFADDDQLRSSASPTVYSVPADLQWMEIYKTMNRCKSTLQSYMDIAKTFLKTGKIDLKMLESLNSTSARLAKTFDQQRTQMEVFFKESVVSNFDHVSYVLDVQSQPMTSVISTFEQKCTTMYITMGIRKASIYLNMSVDYLSQYFDRRRTLLTVAEHFDSNHMKYFMEEVRTFASGTFHNKEFSMESTNCLDMLLIEYYAMLKVYELVKPALNGMKIGYYTHKDNAMPSINQLDNYNFDKVELLDVILKLDDVIKIMEEFKQSLKTDQQFYRDNFLHLNILFHELRYEQLTQQIDYTIFALMGDIGGAMGLCIGASALSVFEIIDFITILLASIMVKRKRSSKSHPTVVHVKPKNELNVKPVY
ncbi:uncharacterized protein LOC132545538 [Ylistrum balloti]|uniref:uncharacterized protein LOC132545538 n=1 Tax=Ylistrum balloti TaxID=509963 RepID=UPI00290592E3|nr:uncharacterized protein LOC132545538 [Ylistrum balloti]